MKKLFIVLSFLVGFATLAHADMYMDCSPKKGVGHRNHAGLLSFNSSGDWDLKDGKTKVVGELRGNPEGKGFVVISGDASRTIVYKFYSADCDGNSTGRAQATLSSAKETVLLNTYTCVCAVD